MSNHNLTNITIDSSGNNYLKLKKNNIIDIYDNTNSYEDNLVNTLINNEKLLVKNKKLKEENEKLRGVGKKYNDIKIQNEELLNENSMLKKRLSQINYNNKNTKFIESNFIDDDDNLLNLSIKNSDITLSKPFKLFSKLIIQFSEIENILKKFINSSKEYQHDINIEEQESDDLLFYKSIILDSIKFYNTSHNIRKNKLVYDINQILKMFKYPNMPSVNEVNNTTKGILKKYYDKLDQDVKDNNQSIQKPMWIKNNKYKYIETIKREMNRTFLYHIEINSHYLANLIKEINFFKIQ